MVQLVINAQGWRAAYLMLAAIMLTFGLLPSVLFVRRHPEDMGLRIDGDQSIPPNQSPGTKEAKSHSVEEQWRLGEASRTLTLWLLLASMFLLGLVSTGVSLYLVPYLVLREVDNTAAVGAVSVTFLVAAMGNVGFGYLADKLSVRYLFVVVYGLRAISLGFLLMIDSLPEAYLFAVMHGLTEGGSRTLTALMLANYYGRQHIGSIYGLSRSFQVAGFALGPIISAAVFDVTTSYSGAFISFMFLAILGVVLVAAARKPTKRAA